MGKFLKRRIKICHVSSAHSSTSSRIFHKFCVSSAKAGYDVAFVVADSSKSRISSGVEIITIEKPANRLGRFVFTPRKILKVALRQDADIYQLHDPELLQIVTPLIKRGKKVIFDFHEDVPFQILAKNYIPNALKTCISYIFSLYQFFIVKKLNAVISATPTIALKFEGRAPRSIAVCNFPDTDFFQKERPKSIRNNSLIYIGGISEDRGIIETVKSLEYCNQDVTLTLCGTFENDKLKKKVTELEGWKKVRFRGQIPKNEVIHELNNASFGIVTLHPIRNYREALPIKLFEYMSSGLPVIASNFPIWEQIVYDSKCGLCVDPMSAKEISEAINKLVIDTDLAKNMGVNARIASQKKYNWESQFNLAHQLYQQLLS